MQVQPETSPKELNTQPRLSLCSESQQECVIHNLHEAHVMMALKGYCVPRLYIEYNLVGGDQDWI